MGEGKKEKRPLEDKVDEVDSAKERQKSEVKRETPLHNLSSLAVPLPVPVPVPGLLS